MNKILIFICLAAIITTGCANKNSKSDLKKKKTVSELNKFNINDVYSNDGLLLLKSTNLPVTGYVVSFNEAGQLSSEEYFVNGCRHGVWKIFNEDGSLLIKRNYVNNKLDGVSTYWSVNGRIYRESNYKNGELHGAQKTWYENGQIREIENFENGLRKGWQIFFNENGELIYSVNLKNGNGKISYIIPETEKQITFKFENGKIVEPENGMLSLGIGDEVNFRKEGTVIKEHTYKNGELVLKRYIRLKNDLVKTEVNYKCGEQHGSYKQWHENGQLAEEGVNYFGNPNGTWQKWHENGKLQEISKYDYGKLISKKCWDESGKSIECECYNNYGDKIPCPK